MRFHLLNSDRPAVGPSPRIVCTIEHLSLLRVLLISIIGGLVLYSTPPSLGRLDAADFAILAWGLLPLVGGLVAAYGLFRRNPQAEVVGCFTIASGFGTWAAAVLMGPVVGATQVAVAGAFFVISIDCIIRALVSGTGMLNHRSA